MNPAKAEHVLQALSRTRIDALTKEELVTAFHDDELFDLEGVAEHILKRLRHDLDLERDEPHITDFAALGTRTARDRARDIVHPIPEVPFRLAGVEYAPEDLSRFNGEPLLFVPVPSDVGYLLHVFQEPDANVIAAYLQARQMMGLIGIRDVVLPPGPHGPLWPPFPPEGSGDPGYTWGCGGTTGIPCGRSGQPPEPTPHPKPTPPPTPFPTTWDQVQMFDSGLYTGNWFWLARNYMWTDLRMVSRGGLFGGDWNDEIFSISATNTYCLYAEHINFEGSRLLLAPNRPIENLIPLGFANRISSVWNYDLT